MHRTPKKTTPESLYIVTGFSGAGKSIALKTLEDIGFFCIDNLPCALFQSFFNTVVTDRTLVGEKVAIGIDVRSGTDMTVILKEIMQWREQCGTAVKIMFIDATPATLIKRFQETRRKHPLGNKRDLMDALAYEKHLLQPLKAYADIVIDTDQLNVHQLRLLVRNLFLTDSQPNMMITLTSFGFKYGAPAESNFVFDVRSLPNPYFVPELKMLDGMVPMVQEYLFAQKEVQEYWKNFVDFFTFSMQKSYQEGRSFMHIAIGCTGGRHRSVACVEKLAQLPIPHAQFFIKHRDIHKEIV